MSAPLPSGRIGRRFTALAAEGRAALVTFVTAGDPDAATSLALLRGLPAAGADLIEVGMPFSDPVADGPAIQDASRRARKGGASLASTLALVRAFRAGDDATPIILMGYFNPIYRFGVGRFLDEAVSAGVDGLIVVDLPPEEDEELCLPALASGLNFIRLTSPTTDDARLPAVLRRASGFVYYISITGITGTGTAAESTNAAAVARLRRHTDLPVAVGFGLSTPAQVAAAARVADAAVVGSAIVNCLAAGLDDQNRPRPGLIDDVLALVGQLAAGVRTARS